MTQMIYRKLGRGTEPPTEIKRQLLASSNVLQLSQLFQLKTKLSSNRFK